MRRKQSGRDRAGGRVMLAIAALLLALSVLAPSGQASEGESLEAEIQAATREARKAAEKANLRLQREAAQNARRQARREAREPTRLASKERVNGVVSMSCSAVTITYRNFPDLPGNTVVEYLKIRGKLFPLLTHEFDGPTSVQTIPIVGPVGHYLIDVHAKWRTNGVSGNFDIPGNVTCGPAPAFTIEKLQAIGGSGLPATTAQLAGQVGQTVDYEIRVTNTGNTPLTFSEFDDKHCDPGTIAGGPGEVPVEPQGVTTFMCTHKLTEVGTYTNVASIEGTPEAEEGGPIPHESNTVEVTPITAPKEEEKPAEKEKEKTTQTTTPTPLPPAGGVLGSTTTATPTPKSGVLGFASATIPALKGPQGCVRSAFTASIRSAGVSSVTFYLDGKKLKTLSSKSSRKGLISIRVDPSKLEVGAHHVVAKITMKKSSQAAAATHATRSLTVIRCHAATVTPHFTG